MADTSHLENKIGLLIWKTANYWQSSLRKILIPYNISLNEFLIIQSIKLLSLNKSDIYQNEIANFVGIDISVTSVTLKLLEKKNIITRSFENDNRKKIIKLLNYGNSIFTSILPLIEKEEEKIFNKLNNETLNFINSLKLILGKKIRIKANKQI